MISEPSFMIEKKDHDFVIGVNIEAKFRCEGEEKVQTEQMQIPAVAIECKTYLDKTMLEGASNETEFEILRARNNYNINTTQGKLDFLNECVRILSTASPIEQDLYMSRLAEELGVDKNSIKLQLASSTRRAANRARRRETSSAVTDSMRKNHKESFDASTTTRKLRAEDRLIGLLLHHNKLIKYTDEIDVSMLTAGFHQKIYSLVCERISLKLDVDLMHFSENLSDNEMGRLSGIIARSADSTNPEKEFLDCIKIISEEYSNEQVKNTDMDNISDDDFRKLFG